MNRLTEIKWSFLFSHSYVRICSGATVHIGQNVSIYNSRIIVAPGSSIWIGDNVSIENTEISVVNGKCRIEDYDIIGSKAHRQLLNIESGEITIGHHSKIDTQRIWVRYNGNVTIGNYTNINSGSEIRCDESVCIGNYNQISFNVKIWDTNTHSILSREKRRERAEKYYPYFGKELSRPKTAPVIIGDDCWLGQNSTLLKGTHLENEVIVGFGCIIVGKYIQSNSTVVQEATLKIRERI